VIIGQKWPKITPLPMNNNGEKKLKEGDLGPAAGRRKESRSR
jgi:hypothetical protein